MENRETLKGNVVPGGAIQHLILEEKLKHIKIRGLTPRYCLYSPPRPVD